MAWATTFPISRLAQMLNDDNALLDEDQEGVLEDAAFLEEACPMIEATLGDAEKREIRDTSVKLWLRDLKYLAADAEDIREEYEYHLLEREGATSAGVRGPDEIKGFDGEGRYIQEMFPNELSKRIRMIRKRFDNIKARREALHLKEDDDNRHRKTTIERQVGHCAIEPVMCGRHDEKKHLVNLLRNNKLLDSVISNHNNEYISVVIGLVGVGGIGKTTLAQAIFKDEEINKYFDCRAWVTVSETFDVVQITKGILEYLTGVDSNLTQLSVIQEKLERRLQGQKFFLVLDDVWKEKLSSLGFLLQMGLVGSKILITTRIRRVIDTMWPSIAFDLEPLLKQDGWELFCRHAFKSKSEDCVAPDLLRIGKQIAERCRGFPLLLKVLGDDLREVGVDNKRWTKILNHKTWEIKDDSENNVVMEILRLSYNHLPRRLKQCFLHCSVFPKDYKFRMDELARLWAAHGLIEKEAMTQIEHIGEECVNGLFQRSFIQPYGYEYSWYTKRRGVTFSLHDVMHDLGQYILESEKPLIENRSNTLDLHHPLMVETSQTLKCYYEPIVGRTFLQCWYPSKQVVIFDMLAQHLKRLRVLILKDHFLKVMPDSIGDLKHLRYLCLRTHQLRRLPDSVCSLLNLQTLECQYLQELPQDMRKLKRLQHLLVNLTKLPLGIGELVELQTLKKFRVSTRGDNECARLVELKDLRHLGGEFKISGLNNVDGDEEAKLSSKPNLQHLVLEWDPIKEDDSCEQSTSVLGNLKPHEDLKELDIFFYVGARFPKWLGSPSFSKLTKVNLFYCSRCVTLPTLGMLLSLKQLYLKHLDCLERIGPEFYGTGDLLDAFPSLDFLDLSHMDSLGEWWGMDKCPFPRLNALYLAYCPSLRFSISDMDVEQAGLARMFDTVQHLFVSCSPHVEKWCRDHAFTTLTKVKDITVDSTKFYLRRRGDKTFFS